MKPFSIAKNILNNVLDLRPHPNRPMHSNPRTEAFTFGEAIPITDGNDLSNYMECWFNGRWYEPQANLHGLSKTVKGTPYLSSAINFKKNYLSNLFIPHPHLSKKDFDQIALDILWSGNFYLEDIRSRLNNRIQLKAALSKYTRVGDLPGQFFYLSNDHNGYVEHEFMNGRVFHVRETDIDQEIYGVPEYLSALQSAWLNDSATLFRRKYYNNGSHAGFILYVNDPASDPNDITALRTALKESKGPGNFRNLFYYSPNGKKDGIQVIPTSEIAAKDDFVSIKGTSRDDMLASMRVYPQLLGIIPSNAGGFGDIKSASEAYNFNEGGPLKAKMLQLNEMIGDEVIKFKEFELITTK